MAKRKRAKPQKDSPDLNNARSSWERGRFAEALHRFDKAIRRQPNHPMALIDAARAFGSRFQADKATKILAHLEKICAGQIDEIVEAAQAYVIAKRPQDAIRCLNKVLAKDPQNATANYEIAALLEAEGDAESAAKHIETSLEAKPDSDEARLLHAKLLTQLGDPDYAYAILVELAEPGVRPLVRAEALSMTATIQESEQDYAEAFDTMIESNAALDRISTKAREEAEAIEPILMQLQGAVKATHLKKWAKLEEHAEKESPALALMTAPFRAGANLLGALLDRHPDISVAKHISTFADDIFPAALMAGDPDDTSRSTELFRTMDNNCRQRESERYRKLLLQCLPDRDIMPGYLIDNSPSIVPLIPSFLRIVPSGAIIVPIRDPRDMLVSSLFAHFPPERNTTALSHPFDAADKITFELETWLAFRTLLDPEQFIEVRYEELVKNPTAEVLRVSSYLGYEELELKLPEVHQKSVGRWRHYEEPLAAYFKELEPLVEAFEYS